MFLSAVGYFGNSVRVPDLARLLPWDGGQMFKTEDGLMCQRLNGSPRG